MLLLRNRCKISHRKRPTDAQYERYIIASMILFHPETLTGGGPSEEAAYGTYRTMIIAAGMPDFERIR
ncbi:uncharacterized protein ARMOST_02133 [Armillaria ostoyae]|uniref:Uncharacterized protein n=1 Tax=Armillaria ostoyae TaxID=47428 RepID=A0A284QR33_ARMOS|nr:uncharacterized protein ARMOST_02133 [Armillaria ostoyae]